MPRTESSKLRRHIVIVSEFFRFPGFSQNSQSSKEVYHQLLAQVKVARMNHKTTIIHVSITIFYLVFFPQHRLNFRPDPQAHTLFCFCFLDPFFFTSLPRPPFHIFYASSQLLCPTRSRSRKNCQCSLSALTNFSPMACIFWDQRRPASNACESRLV
jgi:hypothetical protein